MQFVSMSQNRQNYREPQLFYQHVFRDTVLLKAEVVLALS